MKIRASCDPSSPLETAFLRARVGCRFYNERRSNSAQPVSSLVDALVFPEEFSVLFLFMSSELGHVEMLELTLGFYLGDSFKNSETRILNVSILWIRMQ